MLIRKLKERNADRLDPSNPRVIEDVEAMQEIMEQLKQLGYKCYINKDESITVKNIEHV